MLIPGTYETADEYHAKILKKVICGMRMEKPFIEFNLGEMYNYVYVYLLLGH